MQPEAVVQLILEELEERWPNESPGEAEVVRFTIARFVVHCAGDASQRVVCLNRLSPEVMA